MPDLEFEAIGTHWQISTELPVGSEIAAAITTLIDDADKIWSRFRADSLVRSMAERPGPYSFDPVDAALLDFYAELYRITDGAVTPLVARTLEHLGYDADYRLLPRPGTRVVARWNPDSDWDGTTLTVRADQLLDVGAAGKGWLVDRVGALLAAHGHSTFVVDAGGDMLHRGPTPIRVALEHPADPRKAIGVVSLHNAALCGSAVNRRAWGDGLHHVIDPTTAAPTTDVLATWVLADSAMVADGLATALFFTTGAGLAARTDRTFHHVRISAAGGLTRDPTFPGEVFG